jgi:hypothetical protein
MPSQVCAEETLVVGEPVVISAKSPTTDFEVAFEDDGDTGYFYAIQQTADEMRFLDAVHIYNAKGVTDGKIPSKVQLVWSEDGLKALLAINRYVHAAFDFAAKRGYCRTGFPPPDKNWSTHGHEWDDAVLALFR